MTRADAQSLDFRSPPCSICDGDTVTDSSGFTCGECQAAWDSDGEFYEWIDDVEDQCESTYRPSWAAETFRCILGLGHDVALHSDGTLIRWESKVAQP